MKTIEVVAGILKDGELSHGGRILATQRGYGDYKGLWEFPGGKMELGESPEQALVRELKEELAVDVSVEQFLCTVDYDYPTFHLKMHCYFCTIAAGNLTLQEHLSAEWLKVEDLNTKQWLPADVIVVEKILD